MQGPDPRPPRQPRRPARARRSRSPTCSSTKGKIVSTKGRNTIPKTYDAQKEATYEDFPMVVLVNQNSASASEIVSAASRTTSGPTVVGQRSYGKGSVQNILELEDGNSVLKLTVASYYRPSGENIHRFQNAKPTDKWGVSPDPGMEVKLSTRRVHRLVQGPSRPRPARAGQASTQDAGRGQVGRREGRGQPGQGRRTPRTRSRPATDQARAAKVDAAAKDHKFVDKVVDKASRSSRPSSPQPPHRPRRPRTRPEPIRPLRHRRSPGEVVRPRHGRVPRPTARFASVSIMPPDRRPSVFLAIETTCDETGAAVLEGPRPPADGRAADPLQRGGLADRAARAVRRRGARDRLAGPRPADPAGDRRGPPTGRASGSATSARSPWRPGRGWSGPWSSA